MKLVPLGDRVIVRAVDEEEVSAGGIVLPDTAKERPQRGRVIAVGRGRVEDGTRIPPDVREGDEVVYAKYGGTEIKLQGEEILILAEHDILAKVVGEGPAARTSARTSAAPAAHKTRRAAK